MAYRRQKQAARAFGYTQRVIGILEAAKSVTGPIAVSEGELTDIYEDFQFGLLAASGWMQVKQNRLFGNTYWVPCGATKATVVSLDLYQGRVYPREVISIG